jgi:hypothetical protein
MDSVISFLAINLVVTVLGYVDWMRTQDKKHVSMINRWGLIVSIAVPVMLFLILIFIK